MAEQQEIQELRRQLQELTQQHGSWAVLKDLATILTPVVLLVGGFLVQRTMATDSAQLTQSLETQKKTFDLTLENMRGAREESAQKIEQSKLLTSLMQSMLSQQPSERQLAINIALHACGEAGRQVVAAVGVGDADAQKQLNTRRKNLVEQLVARDPHMRWTAAQELGSTWASDPQLPNDLLLFAKANARTPLALYNALVVFADLPGTAYIGKGDVVREALRLAETTGPKGEKTTSLLRQVQQKLAAAEVR